MGPSWILVTYFGGLCEPGRAFAGLSRAPVAPKRCFRGAPGPKVRISRAAVGFSSLGEQKIRTHAGRDAKAQYGNLRIDIYILNTMLAE